MYLRTVSVTQNVGLYRYSGVISEHISWSDWKERTSLNSRQWFGICLWRKEESN